VLGKHELDEMLAERERLNLDIQQVLDACNEFKVPCGFPANTPDVMEARYKQGFRVFVIGWGDNGFKTVEAGLKLSGRQK